VILRRLKNRLKLHKSLSLNQSDKSGRWGERQAERLLKKKGICVLGRRIRVGKRDEFDLIARDGQVLVFVEVKTRKNTTFGRPIEAVNKSKRHALSRAAVRYLKKLKKPPAAFRFDVVEVIGTSDNCHPEIHHIENAFQLEKQYRIP